MRTETPILAPIFRSEGQAKLLAGIFLQEGEVGLSDLARESGLAYSTAHREVSRLVTAGILVEREVGRTRLISANRSSPLFEPLSQIIHIIFGPAMLLSKELVSIPGIRFAFLYGSFASRMDGIEGPAPKDIDLMVVGTPNPELVLDVCDRIEKIVRRPVNPTILKVEELNGETGFIRQVRANPRVPLVGGDPWV